MFRPFHIALHTLPIAATLGHDMLLDSVTLRLVSLTANDLHTPLDVSFENAIEQLNALPGMFTEPDGSFTWGSDSREPVAWRLDGCLYDRDGHVMYVELKGACSSVAWQKLIRQLCPGGQPLLTQWMERGVFMSEQEFQKWLGN